MIVISLFLGIILGGMAVIFILQNVVVVTVSFLGFQFSASLALVLLLTLLTGFLTALLLLLPSLISDVFFVSRLKRQNKDLVAELESHKVVVPPIPPTPVAEQAQLP